MSHTMKSPIDKQEILASHALFKGLDRAIIARLASRAVTQRTKAGTTLFRKGDSGSRLYAVCSGAVKISSSAIRKISVVVIACIVPFPLVPLVRGIAVAQV